MENTHQVLYLVWDLFDSGVQAIIALCAMVIAYKIYRSR